MHTLESFRRELSVSTQFSVGVGLGVGLGVGIGVGLGVGEMAGAAVLIATPLFQTNFFPDLIQVYFFPL